MEWLVNDDSLWTVHLNELHFTRIPSSLFNVTPNVGHNLLPFFEYIRTALSLLINRYRE